ncbi:MAG: hypothetical protein V7765_17080 [Oleispira sp.]
MEPKDYIYALGIFLTFALGIWNFIQGYHATRKASFINTVTSQRILWIEQMRQDVSKFVGLTLTLDTTTIEESAPKLEICKEIDYLCYVIRLRLNPDDTPDRKIAALIKKIQNLTESSNRNELLSSLELLTKETQDMLKNEWDKVKAESKDGDLSEK